MTAGKNDQFELFFFCIKGNFVSYQVRLKDANFSCVFWQEIEKMIHNLVDSNMTHLVILSFRYSLG